MEDKRWHIYGILDKIESSPLEYREQYRKDLEAHLPAWLVGTYFSALRSVTAAENMIDSWLDGTLDSPYVFRNKEN